MSMIQQMAERWAKREVIPVAELRQALREVTELPRVPEDLELVHAHFVQWAGEELFPLGDGDVEAAALHVEDLVFKLIAREARGLRLPAPVESLAAWGGRQAELELLQLLERFASVPEDEGGLLGPVGRG
jgi:hypothetical protein